jgi:hypothetical protein
LWAFSQTPARHARPLAATIAQQCAISCESTPVRVHAHISVASPIHRPRPALSAPSHDRVEKERSSPVTARNHCSPSLPRHPTAPSHPQCHHSTARHAHAAPEPLWPRKHAGDHHAEPIPDASAPLPSEPIKRPSEHTIELTPLHRVSQTSSPSELLA